MTAPDGLSRSPEMMGRTDSALLVVDVQEKLIGAIRDHARVVWNIGRLLDGARLLGIPAAASEQYPQGLGGTVAELAGRLGTIPAKLTFSCRDSALPLEAWRDEGRFKILLCGIESHVCVQQTALDLLAAGFRVYLAADAVGSRGQTDHEIALRRMDSAGVTLTSTEAALFEWCEEAGTPEFKGISELVKQRGPD